MTDADNLTDADPIGDQVEQELVRLVIMGGHHPDEVLAAALARIMALVTLRHGGDAAADAARKVARQCRGLPSYADNPLAGMPAQGRA